MGSYLSVNGIECSSKQESGAMIDLMRELLPEKKSLHGEELFVLSPEELATVSGSAVMLARDGRLAVDFVQNVYAEKDWCPFHDKSDYDDIVETYTAVALILGEALAGCVLDWSDGVMCKWS